jgi:hypothetical protein
MSKDGKIIELKLAKDQPNRAIVKFLETLLKRAKDGKITHLVGNIGYEDEVDDEKWVAVWWTKSGNEMEAVYMADVLHKLALEDAMDSGM